MIILGFILIVCGILFITAELKDGMTYELIFRKLKGGTPASREAAKDKLAGIWFGISLVVMGIVVIVFSFFY